jgi:hypothetical protein
MSCSVLWFGKMNNENGVQTDPKKMFMLRIGKFPNVYATDWKILGTENKTWLQR